LLAVPDGAEGRMTYWSRGMITLLITFLALPAIAANVWAVLYLLRVCEVAQGARGQLHYTLVQRRVP
jgi:hypothetical protein